LKILKKSENSPPVIVFENNLAHHLGTPAVKHVPMDMDIVYGYFQLLTARVSAKIRIRL
jgi:hypothetical protein